MDPFHVTFQVGDMLCSAYIVKKQLNSIPTHLMVITLQGQCDPLYILNGQNDMQAIFFCQCS